MIFYVYYHVVCKQWHSNFVLPVWMPTSFSCLTAAARTSSTMLNKSGKCGRPCLLLDISGKALRFSPLSMMLAMGFSYMAFIMLRYVPSNPTEFLL